MAKKKSMMRSLGLFVHNLGKGFKPLPKDSQVVSKEVQERTVETPGGPVTLRRTTIDEVEVKREGSGN